LIFLWLLSFYQEKESDRKLNFRTFVHGSNLGTLQTLVIAVHLNIFFFACPKKKQKKTFENETARFGMGFSIRLL